MTGLRRQVVARGVRVVSIVCVAWVLWGEWSGGVSGVSGVSGVCGVSSVGDRKTRYWGQAERAGVAMLARGDAASGTCSDGLLGGRVCGRHAHLSCWQVGPSTFDGSGSFLKIGVESGCNARMRRRDC